MIVAWKERKSLDWKVWLPLCIMVILGGIPGVFLLKNVDGSIIKVIFGVFVILVGIEMLLRGKAKKRKQSPLVFVIVGLVAGVFCGLFGIGIILAAYINRISDNSHDFKGNLCMVFVVENIMRIVMYSIAGIITLESLKTSAMLVPFMLAGVFLGIKSSSVLNEEVVKRIVIIMLKVSGVAMILMNI